MNAEFVAIWSFPEGYDNTGDLLNVATSWERFVELMEKNKNAPNLRFKINGEWYDKIPEGLKFVTRSKKNGVVAS